MSLSAITALQPRRSLRAVVYDKSIRSSEPEPGDRIRDHVIIKRLGRGGFGDVYEVEHAVLKRRAALKLLHARHAMSAGTRARFEREARIVNGLRHANIVELFEFGETADGRPFYVMELLDGHDLQTELDRRGRLAPHEVAELLGPVCEALAAVHVAGVVHRDIKPSNVFITRTGRVVLLDFGVAKPLHIPSLTRSNQHVGTPAYMAPEQVLHQEITPRVDIYAIGAVAFQLLTGRLPERARPSHYVPELPPALDDVIEKATSADPDARFASAHDFIAAFRDALRAAPAATAHSVAIYIEADRDLDAFGDRWASKLAAHGFVRAFATSSSLLLARPLSPVERATLAPTLLALAAELCAQATVAGIAVEVALAADIVAWANGQAIGGPLLVLDWAAGRPGLHVAPSLLA